MGNRKKPRNPFLAEGETKVDIPIMEKTVHKRVPATIHWSSVDGIDREDSEVIGTAIIYEDGTSDVLVNADISDDAKKLVGFINAKLDNYTIED